jgi:plastocyanin
MAYSQNTTSATNNNSNANQNNLASNLNAKSTYEQKSAVLGNDVKNFVILIPNEAHESTNQPKKQYPLANQPYIPQTITVNKGTSVTWLNGDAGHDHRIKFQTPNPQNIESTDKFSFPGFTTVTLNQTGKYSYFEDNVNNDMTKIL